MPVNKLMMKLLSVAQYAKQVKLSKPGVIKQIIENRLPAGVSAEKVDNFYVIIIAENKNS